MGLFAPKCPYCKGKNLYLKRTFPIEKYGCRDCERKIKIMRENGMADKDIKKVIYNTQAGECEVNTRFQKSKKK